MILLPANAGDFLESWDPLTPPGANEFLDFDRSYLVNGAK